MKVEIDIDKCIGCGRCVKRCRHNVLALIMDESKRYAEAVDLQSCHACGHCEKVCPQEAIKVEKNGIQYGQKLQIFAVFLGILLSVYLLIH